MPKALSGINTKAQNQWNEVSGGNYKTEMISGCYLK